MYYCIIEAKTEVTEMNDGDLSFPAFPISDVHDPVIGVTGPSGAGKSVFCGFLRDAGFLVLDCDEIYHRMVAAPSPCTAELAEAFGDGILTSSGSLDRSALAAIVFAPGAGDKLQKLNSITHKYIREEVRRQTADCLACGDYAGVVIDAPLLFQAGFDVDCLLTVAVLAPADVRLSRLTERDGIDADALRARLDAAPPDEYYVSHSDMTVINTGDMQALRREAAAVAEAMLDLLALDET